MEHVDKHVYRARQDLTFVFRTDKTYGINWRTQPLLVVAVCQRSANLVSPATGKSTFDTYINDQCTNAVKSITYRAHVYQNTWHGLLQAFQLERDEDELPSQFPYPRGNATSIRAKRAPEPEFTTFVNDHDSWRAGNAAAKTLGTFIPLVDRIYDGMESARQHDRNEAYERAITELQTEVKKHSVTVSHLVLGQEDLRQQLVDVRRVQRELQRMIQEDRVETQVMITVQAADETSRSLDAAGRLSMNHFEDMVSVLFQAQTPATLWSFRELKLAERKLANQNAHERLYTAVDSMTSIVLPTSNATTLSVLSRVMITGQTANIYEAIAVPHLTSEGKMVKPVLKHRFVLVTSDMYQFIETHEVTDCLRQACEFLGERRRPTGTECGIPLGIQKERAVCSYMEVPKGNYLQSTFSREYLAYAIGGQSLSLDLYCPLLSGSAVQHVTLTGSGTLINPSGCYYSDVVAQLRHYGPIGQSKSLVTLQDTQNMRLHYESKAPQLRATVPHIDIPEPPPVQRISSGIFEPTVSFDQTPKTNKMLLYVMGGIGAVVVAAFCVCIGLAMRWQQRLNKVKNGLGADVASLAGQLVQYAAIANAPTAPPHSRALEPLLPRELVTFRQESVRGSPPAERRVSTATFGKPSPKIGRRQSPQVGRKTSAPKSPGPILRIPMLPRKPSPPSQTVTPASMRRVQFGTPQLADALPPHDHGITDEDFDDAEAIAAEYEGSEAARALNAANARAERAFVVPETQRGDAAARALSPARRYPPATRATWLDTESLPPPDTPFAQPDRRQ